MEISGIEREALEFILGASRSRRPQEFAGVLRAKNGVITEVLWPPETISSGRSAVMKLHMLPIDPSTCGTVHSHPSGSASPSQEDLMLFAKYGRVHIIVSEPFDYHSWRAYDHRGKKIKLKVVER